MKVIGLILGVFCIASAMPIPPQPLGFVRGPASANCTLEIFCDHLCSDCRAQYPKLNDWYTTTNATDWLKLVYHEIPLPYHHNSFLVSVASRYIQDSHPSNFTAVIDWFYVAENQNKYLGATNQTGTQLREMLADDMASITAAANNEILAVLEMPLGSKPTSWNAILAYKYAASQQMCWTPSFRLNGVINTELSSFTTAQNWADFFNNFNS